MANLSEQLANLANPAPVFNDPEDDIHIETRAKLTDKTDDDIDDAGDILYPSNLRKKNEKVLGDIDETYAGKPISRKDLDSFDSENDGSESENDDDLSSDGDAINDFKSLFPKDKQVSDDANEQSDDSSDIKSRSSDDDPISQNEYDDKHSDDEKMYSSEDEESESEEEASETSFVRKFSEIGVADEIEKGKAVKAQLSIWDSLLECRIKMQKLMTLANQLPQHDTWDMFVEKASDGFNTKLQSCQDDVQELMDGLINMQTFLLNNNVETEHVMENDDELAKKRFESAKSKSPKRKLSSQEYESILSKRHKNFINYRNQTIQKWSDKTRISSGKLSQKSFSGFDQSAVKQINQILIDRNRLIKRTQLKRSVHDVLGKVEQSKDDENEMDQDELSDRTDHLQNYDCEIFDDSDFYQQQLRELIERKTADVNNPIALGRQWLEIQKLRGKVKKKVDTKASKGRKIRFTVMPKLVSFMAPIANNQMNDEAKNELFGSLFGKRATASASV